MHPTPKRTIVTAALAPTTRMYTMTSDSAVSAAGTKQKVLYCSTKEGMELKGGGDGDSSDSMRPATPWDDHRETALRPRLQQGSRASEQAMLQRPL